MTGPDHLFGIENAIGTPFPDVFIGNGQANEFVGGWQRHLQRARRVGCARRSGGGHDLVWYLTPGPRDGEPASGTATGVDALSRIEDVLGSGGATRRRGSLQAPDSSVMIMVERHLCTSRGQDELLGRGGKDSILPGPGADVANGGGGRTRSTLLGRTGRDYQLPPAQDDRRRRDGSGRSKWRSAPGSRTRSGGHNPDELRGGRGR